MRLCASAKSNVWTELSLWWTSWSRISTYTREKLQEGTDALSNLKKHVLLKPWGTICVTRVVELLGYCSSWTTARSGYLDWKRHRAVDATLVRELTQPWWKQTYICLAQGSVIVLSSPCLALWCPFISHTSNCTACFCVSVQCCLLQGILCNVPLCSCGHPYSQKGRA